MLKKKLILAATGLALTAPAFADHGTAPRLRLRPRPRVVVHERYVVQRPVVVPRVLPSGAAPGVRGAAGARVTTTPMPARRWWSARSSAPPSCTASSPAVTESKLRFEAGGRRVGETPAPDHRLPAAVRGDELCLSPLCLRSTSSGFSIASSLR
jgi:hypothetical protein